MDIETGKQIIALKDRIVARFNSSDWEELGLLTGCTDLFDNHPRLYRSLNFDDPDYPGNVLVVLQQMRDRNAGVFHQVKAFIDSKYPEDGVFISANPSERKMTFAPNVFHLPPDLSVEKDLATVMMPFNGFGGTHNAIKAASAQAGLRCVRADDIWEHATIIQDIFNLIVRARVVIVDFSGKNPNVMYETGIAHSLGKTVIPITQSMEDVPFDIRHHRVLKYLANGEGYTDLQHRLAEKLTHLEN